MDEVPVPFDIIGNFTVNEKGEHDVKITSTGFEKKFCTLVLCVTADGGKLVPMVIFKRKTIPKEEFPKGIVVQANENGWMTEDMMRIWVKSVWLKRKNSFFNRNPKKSILIVDAHRAHKTEVVKKEIKKHSELAIIPGGLTKHLQPLDISVNSSFKSKLRNCFDQHMRDEFKRVDLLKEELKKAETTFQMAESRTGFQTKTQKKAEIKESDLRPKHVSYVGLCNWIVKCWAEISVETIVNGFIKANVIEGPVNAEEEPNHPSAEDVISDCEDQLISESVQTQDTDDNESIADELMEILTLSSDSD